MLGDYNVMPVLAVKDLSKAKEFYEGTLGLESENGEDPSGIAYKCGDTGLFVYESKFAGTSKATAAGWNVDDIQKVVSDLKEKGIKFEHYDFPGVKLEDDVYVMGSLKAAWFVDPDGNILSIDEM